MGLRRKWTHAWTCPCISLSFLCPWLTLLSFHKLLVCESSWLSASDALPCLTKSACPWILSISKVPCCTQPAIWLRLYLPHWFQACVIWVGGRRCRSRLLTCFCQGKRSDPDARAASLEKPPGWTDRRLVEEVGRIAFAGWALSHCFLEGHLLI